MGAVAAGRVDLAVAIKGRIPPAEGGHVGQGPPDGARVAGPPVPGLRPELLLPPPGPRLRPRSYLGPDTSVSLRAPVDAG